MGFNSGFKGLTVQIFLSPHRLHLGHTLHMDFGKKQRLLSQTVLPDWKGSAFTAR